ncbi:MAG: succinate dehydrogenase cytochrome b subunit [Chloroflexota bacterium]
MIGAAALSLYDSTIGKKVVMAVSGLILFGFVFIHMLGNLKIYFGEAVINKYGVELRELGGPILGHEQGLWIARIILLAAVIAHIVSAYQLTMLDNSARPVAYARRKPQAQTYASRTMRWGGVIVGLFIIYHIMHLTLGIGGMPFRAGDVYSNMVLGFRNPIVSGFYMLAMVALAFHIQHGVWSLFQTLGVRNGSNDSFFRGFATLFAVVIAVGNISIPLSILLGIVK